MIKPRGSDGIVSELLKYGGVGMVRMLGKLYALISGMKSACQ